MTALYERPLSAGEKDVGAFEAALWERPLHRNRMALFSAHQMGGYRLGTDARTSVTGPDGSVHGIEGLHVADGSLFPTPTGVNPMLTIMAVATLVARRLAD